MTDADLALSILTKMANDDPTTWIVERDTHGTAACVEAIWFRITADEADLLDRLNKNR